MKLTNRKSLENAIEEFLAVKHRQLAHVTHRNYKNRLHIFFSFMQHHYPSTNYIHNVTSAQMAEFFAYMGTVKDIDKATSVKYIMVLKQLWKYAKQWGYTKEMPFDLVAHPRKKVDYSPHIIEKAHLDVLIPAMKARDPQLYLACMIQYYCFVRPGNELCKLRVSDFILRPEHESLMIRQENNKNRRNEIITVPVDLIKILKKFDVHKAPKELYLFGSKRTWGTKALSPIALRKRFIALRNELGLPATIKLYSFKHTGASALHRSGVPLVDMMEQLRHFNMKSTEHYIKKHVGQVNPRIRKWFTDPSMS